MYNRIIQQPLNFNCILFKIIHFIYFRAHMKHILNSNKYFFKNPLLGSGNKSFRFLCDQNKYDYNIQKIEEGDRKGQSVGQQIILIITTCKF